MTIAVDLGRKATKQTNKTNNTDGKNASSPLCTSHLYPRPPPHIRGLWWNSRAMVQGKYFLIVPAVTGKCGVYNIGTSAPLRFSVV